MLNIMRKYARSWFIAIAIGAIVVVFIFWGIGSFQSARFQTVATVNNHRITLPEYLRAYNNLLRIYQEKLGGEANEELLKSLKLPEQAVNQLIERALVLQGANNLGLMVTDQELRDHIQKYPAFQDERGFNEKRYFALLSRNRMTPADFEASERDQLLMQKAVQLITSFAKVSEAELQEVFQLEREAAQVDYLVVNPAKYAAAQTAAESDLTTFYEAHKEQFRQPDKARVRYVLVRDQDFAAHVKPSPEEIKDYYQEHRDSFSRPQTIRVRQIFLPEPAKAAVGDKQRLESQARELLQRSQKGENFLSLVNLYSQDRASRPQGGDLGDVVRGKRHPAWEEVAFGLKPGDVGLARTPQGFYIIRMEEIKDSAIPPLEQVKDRLIVALKEQQARQEALKLADTLKKEAASASLAEVAARHRLKVEETPLLAAQDSVPGLGTQPAFIQAALALKPQELSSLIPLPTGVALLQGIARQESRIPPLDEIRPQVKQAVIQDQAVQQASKEAAALLERLQKGEPRGKVAAQAGLPLHSSGWFTRSQGFPGHPQARDLTAAAFQLSAAKPYPTAPLKWQDSFYLLAYKGRRLPPEADFQQVRDQLFKDTLEYKRQLVFTQWLAAERQRAKIKVYELPS